MADPVPKPVPGLTGARRVVVGLWHGCALTDEGLVWCWGQNNAGELGDGSTTASTTAVRIKW